VARRTIPRHEAVERHLRSRIAGLRPGDQIESDAELCELFRVSRMTVRQATQRLVGEGAIYRVSGVGTFVAEPQVHRQMGTLRSFTEEMTLRGMPVSSKVLSAEMRLGTQEETAGLRLAPKSNVVRLRRLRMAGPEPLAIEDVTLPPQFSWLLNVDLANGSLHEALADEGFTPVRAVGTQVAAVADAEDAELLALPVGAPLFIERRLVSTDDDTPIERTESRYAGSRFVFHIELQR
jgi:GntR family transcriptional regulator